MFFIFSGGIRIETLIEIQENEITDIVLMTLHSMLN